MAQAKNGKIQFSPKQFWLLFLMALYFSVSSALAPLWATYVLKLGGNLKTSGIAVAINSSCFAVFNIFWGWLESRYPHEKRYVVSSFFLIAIFYILYPFVKTPIALYLLQVPIGAFSAMMGPALFKLYNQYNQETLSRLGWGIYTAQMNLFMAVGAVLGAHVAHDFGFNAVFYMMTGIAFAASVSAALIL